jgi:hypothetical protein
VAASIDPHGTVEVGDGIEAQQLESQQQSVQIGFAAVVPRA